MKGFIVNSLKYGGLSLSALLTLWLFSDLFWGKTPLGGLLIVASLLLFEGGSLLWIELVNHSKGIQWIISWVCVWICVVASVLSSIAQIVLATNLYSTGGFDMELFTLSMIGLTMFTNVGGVIAFQFLDPDVAGRQMKQMAESFAALRARDRVNEIWREADRQADELLKAQMPEIAAKIAEERKSDVIRMALEATPGGNNSHKNSGSPYQNRQKSQYGTGGRIPERNGYPSNPPSRVVEDDDDDEEEIKQAAVRSPSNQRGGAFPGTLSPTQPRPNHQNGRGQNGK